MVGEACLPSNAYYPRTPDYTLCSGVHVCWSEHSDSSFLYGFMSLDYGFGTMTGTTSSPSPIVVFRDHNPPTFIHKMKNENQRLLRWSLLLQEYNLDIRHIKGKYYS